MTSKSITNHSILRTFTQPVFGLSTFFILAITLLGVVSPEYAKSFFGYLQNWLVVNTSWFYILSVGSVLFFVLWLMMSRLGDIRLGPDDSEPEYSYFSWFYMLLPFMPWSGSPWHISRFEKIYLCYRDLFFTL